MGQPLNAPGGPLAGMPPSGPLVTLIPGQMQPPSMQPGVGIPSTLPPNTPTPAVARNASSPVAPQPRPAPSIGSAPVSAPMGGYSSEVPPTLPPNTPSPVAAMRAAQAGTGAGVGSGGYAGDIPPTLPPSNNSYGDIPPTLPPPARPAPSPQAPLQAAPPSNVGPGPGGGMLTCPRCSSSTPSSFAYCQNCGFHLGAIAPTNPDTGRPRTPSGQQAPIAALSLPVDPGGATLAAPGPSSRAEPARAAAAAWGTAVLVNRDGSDGERFPLASEAMLIGRKGADIAFDEDRFLARHHARLERGGDGSVRVTPMDAVNGVFRKADVPVELADGMQILVGREVLRFEKVDAEERAAAPLVRHGVAVFGSPPREPYGRFIQLIPSGGSRDVRHLMGDEVVLGREEGDIVFRDDQFMSRRHAAVNWDGKRAMLTDLGSSNGTFIRLLTPTVLKNGDHLRMGDQLLRIELAR
jgi:pSer/pThr/pTyr-binding forkhead associated (FHA) protein